MNNFLIIPSLNNKWQCSLLISNNKTAQNGEELPIDRPANERNTLPITIDVYTTHQAQTVVNFPENTMDAALS